jgi:cytochrome P450
MTQLYGDLWDRVTNQITSATTRSTGRMTTKPNLFLPFQPFHLRSIGLHNHRYLTTVLIAITKDSGQGRHPTIILTAVSEWRLWKPARAHATMETMFKWFSGSEFFLSICCVLAFILLLVCFKRQRTKVMLERCGLPTIFWIPQFISYRPFEEDQKLASSKITRILPRMKRLGGPYGMYGTVYGISTPVIHVAHPVPANAILNGSFPANVGAQVTSNGFGTSQRRRSSTSFVKLTGASKAPAYNHFKNFCGEGVFTADGEDWKAKRAAVMHTLIKGSSSSSEMSKRLETEANQAADVFCQQVESLISIAKSIKTDTCEGVLITNIVPLLQRSTLGLIYRYITHDELDWESPHVVELADRKKHEEGVDSEETVSFYFSKDGDVTSVREECGSLLTSYLKSIVRIRMIILAQSRSIWFLLPRWCYRYFSSLYRDEEATLCPIREFARKACLNAKPQSPLYRLATMEGAPHYHQRPSNGHDISLQKRNDDDITKNLLDEAITLLFAGQDTSAATLSWTLHLLSLHPHIQQDLALEVQNVFMEEIGDDEIKDRHRLVTKKVISKLPLLDAVIKESMRLYPVAPFIVRRLTEAISLPPSSFGSPSLPCGSVACIWIYGLHRNPEFWERPDEFLPERWMNADLKKNDRGQTNGAYMPFASGPRNCLGQPLAHVILRTLLSKLIYQFEFIEPKLSTFCDSKLLRKDMQAGFTVLPAGGVELVVRRRDQKEKSA